MLANALIRKASSAPVFVIRISFPKRPRDGRCGDAGSADALTLLPGCLHISADTLGDQDLLELREPRVSLAVKSATRDVPRMSSQGAEYERKPNRHW